MRSVVLLVKNGIGFGHIRRALLVAEAVQTAGKLRPFVVSQASSLALLRDSSVRTVNFPLLHRLPSAVTEDCCADLLNRLLERLDPAVVVEDTYPDPRYLTMPALADRPRLLVMRRLDGLSFDRIRSLGRFAAYEEILIAQSDEDFEQEGHSGESSAAVRWSGRFKFVGNLAYAPSPEAVARVRVKYAPSGEQIVVVNGGAGGDQMADNYGDRLYQACRVVAERLKNVEPLVRFVFVTGPYYAGRPLRDAANISVRRFEPSLPALLAAARVVVIKPGNNAVSEALQGGAHLVLVPDVSFMEGLDEHAARLVERYGGTVATPDAARLEAAVREGLRRPPRTQRSRPDAAGMKLVVDAIHRHALDRGATVPRRQLLLIVVRPRGCPADALRHQLPGGLAGATILDESSRDGLPTVASADAVRNGAERAFALLVGGEAPPAPPQQYADSGVSLLVSGTIAVAEPVLRWLRMAPPRPALLVAAGDTIRATRDRADAFGCRVRDVLAAADPACLVLDLQDLGDARALHDYLARVARWLRAQPIELVGADVVAARQARRLLEPA